MVNGVIVMLKFTTAMALCCMTAGTAASAATLSENFSSGLNGWQVYGTSAAQGANGTANSGANVSVQPTGGPAGGADPWLSMSDSTGSWMHAVFGNGWSGDLSGFDGGTFSLDYIQTVPSSGSNFFSSFGFFRVTGGGQSVGVDIIPSNPSSSWNSVAVSFSAGTFGISQSQWDNILANVTEIRIQAESWSGITETVGFDNVKLTTLAPVPLPASVVLLLGALGMLSVGRRQRA